MNELYLGRFFFFVDYSEQDGRLDDREMKKKKETVRSNAHTRPWCTSRPKKQSRSDQEKKYS